MLVINVSLHPPRSVPIGVAVVDVGAARDTLATESAILAALVDDPAWADSIVDAYIGDLIFEAASATDTVSVVVSVYTVAVDEVASAADTVSATASVSVLLSESAVADSAQNGTIITALVPRHAMVPGVQVNSDGTLREANVNGVMVNL